MIDVAPTMFGAPRWNQDTAYDVVFVGVPTDTGGLGHRSPAAAPGFLRSTSTLFPLMNGRTGGALGWFDYTTRTTLLQGVRMADAGDFPCSRAEGIGQLSALPYVYETLRESTKLLVILGGDHSISYFLGKALDQEGIVWVDAHEDAAGKNGAFPDCANVVSHLDDEDAVQAIAQFGLRGIVPADRREPPAKRRLCASAEDVVSALRAHSVSSTAVTVDVDVFDPSLLPAVGSALPEGLRSTDVLRVVAAVRNAGIRIPVLEVAEFAPVSELDVTSGLFLVNFLLRAIALSLD
ncbi:arginase family protein [Pendulispora brunnea]|uniref:Arginase family protein n=1 Tax=Pendulispora brunnea TaxID=2905690 RepID=A0ABZ2K3I6_9BACT